MRRLRRNHIYGCAVTSIMERNQDQVRLTDYGKRICVTWKLRIRGDATSRRLSLSNAMVPLIEPLSVENLVGEAITSGVPAAVAATTALSTTFVQASSVSPVPTSDYEVVDTEPQAEASSSPMIVFEQDTLETLSEHPAT
ncbi:hypothetical protein Tco_1431536 [Tanacetum coccineum]